MELYKEMVTASAPNVCFSTRDNKVILLVLNDTVEQQEFNFNDSTTLFSAT